MHIMNWYRECCRYAFKLNDLHYQIKDYLGFTQHMRSDLLAGIFVGFFVFFMNQARASMYMQ